MGLSEGAPDGLVVGLVHLFGHRDTLLGVGIVDGILSDLLRVFFCWHGLSSCDFCWEPQEEKSSCDLSQEHLIVSKISALWLAAILVIVTILLLKEARLCRSNASHIYAAGSFWPSLCRHVSREPVCANISLATVMAFQTLKPCWRSSGWWALTSLRPPERHSRRTPLHIRTAERTVVLIYPLPSLQQRYGLLMSVFVAITRRY